MIKKSLCITECVVHFILTGLLIVWVAKYDDVPVKIGILLADVLFVIFCFFIGIVFLKLDIDKLFIKLEANAISRTDNIIILTSLVTALLIVGFETLMVAVYFFKGVKMEPGEFIRFIVLPSLSLLHLTTGTCCYLAFQYFMTNGT